MDDKNLDKLIKNGMNHKAPGLEKAVVKKIRKEKLFNWDLLIPATGIASLLILLLYSSLDSLTIEFKDYFEFEIYGSVLTVAAVVFTFIFIDQIFRRKFNKSIN